MYSFQINSDATTYTTTDDELKQFFASRADVVSVAFDESVKSLPKMLFAKSKNLKSVSGPGVETIGESCFDECDALEDADFPELMAVGDSAFKLCTALKEAEFPKLASAGNEAFIYCHTLESVEFPELRSTSGNLFAYCTSLTFVKLPRAQFLEFMIFFNCVRLEAVEAPIANVIGEEAFKYCKNLKKAEFPAVRTLEEGAFSDCTALTTVDLPAVEEIGSAADRPYNAFQGCRALTSVNLPMAKKIGPGTFSDCTALQSLDLPSAEDLTHHAFSGCTALTFVKLASITTISSGIFFGAPSLRRVSMPALANLTTMPQIKAEAERDLHNVELRLANARAANNERLIESEQRTLFDVKWYIEYLNEMLPPTAFPIFIDLPSTFRPDDELVFEFTGGVPIIFYYQSGSVVEYNDGPRTVPKSLRGAEAMLGNDPKGYKFASLNTILQNRGKLPATALHQITDYLKPEYGIPTLNPNFYTQVRSSANFAENPPSTPASGI